MLTYLFFLHYSSIVSLVQKTTIKHAFTNLRHASRGNMDLSVVRISTIEAPKVLLLDIIIIQGETRLIKLRFNGGNGSVKCTYLPLYE